MALGSIFLHAFDSIARVRSVSAGSGGNSDISGTVFSSRFMLVGLGFFTLGSGFFFLLTGVSTENTVKCEEHREHE